MPSPAEIALFQDLLTTSTSPSNGPERSQAQARVSELLNASTTKDSLVILITLLRIPNAGKSFVRLVSRLLSLLLLKPGAGGVGVLLEYFFDPAETTQNPFIVSENKEDVEQLVESLLLTPPSSLGITPRDYISNICSQLLDIICEDKNTTREHFATVLAIKIAYKWPGWFKDYFLDVGCAALDIDARIRYISTASSSTKTDLNGSMIVSTEDALLKSLTILQTLISASLSHSPNNLDTPNTPAANVIISMIQSYVPVLFHLHAYLQTSPSHLKQLVQELLVAILVMMDTQDVVMTTLDVCEEQHTGRAEYTFSAGESGGIQIVLPSIGSSQIQPASLLHTQTTPAESGDDTTTIIDLLQLADDQRERKALGELLLETLKRYEISKREGGDIMRTAMLAPLLLDLISLGPDIISSPSQILSFAKNLLTGLSSSRVKESSNTVFEDTGATDTDEATEIVEDTTTRSLIFGLLGLLLSSPSSSLTPEDRSSLENILVSLSVTSVDEGLKEIAAELRTHIKQNVDNLDSQTEGNTSSDEKKYQESLTEIVAKEVPIRAKGLNTLRRLVLSRSSIVEDNIDKILNVYMESLKDDDSFVYLNAVRGLSALTDIFPEETIDTVVDKYCEDIDKVVGVEEIQEISSEEQNKIVDDEKVSEQQRKQLDYKLRLGEAILQTIFRYGEVVVKYADTILPAILKTLHAPSRHLRSSSLSLISALIEVSPYCISPFIHQLLSFIKHLLIFESHPETRRGAIHILVTTIKFNALPSLGTKARKEIWRIIKNVEDDINEDEIVRGHARVGVEMMMEEIMGDLLLS